MFFRKKIDIQHKDSTNEYINLSANILDIKPPAIIDVGFIFDSHFYDGKEHNERRVILQIKFKPEELPYDAYPYAAFYDDSSNNIYISKHGIFLNEKIEIKYCKFTEAERLFHILHEFRHVWQHTYQYEVYYTTNAIREEIIDDIAEIDADAFAIAFLFSTLTPFKLKDLPYHIQQIGMLLSFDDGKRKKRAIEIAKKYHLTFKSDFSFDECEGGGITNNKL